MEKEALSLKHLSVDFKSESGLVHAVRDVNLSVKYGKTLGIVGESGCGKSVTVKSILRLHDEKITQYQGKIEFVNRQGNEKQLLDLTSHELNQIRGNQISMIFQDPMTSLNPVIRVGEQVSEVIRKHQHLSRKAAKGKTLELFATVGIRSPEKRYNQYPYEFSGGMQQRILIAVALACNPSILLADEPTTALDVTIQSQILKNMKEIQGYSGMAIVFITHDLGVVAHMCDDIAVMYAGQVVEYADTQSLFSNPLHPYTKGLLGTIPRLGGDRKPLETIEGMPPKLTQEIIGCPFAPRCRQCTEECRKNAVELREVKSGRMVRCLHIEGGSEDTYGE